MDLEDLTSCTSCPEGARLFKLWMFSDPMLIALMPRLNRLDVSDTVLATNPTWTRYRAHRNLCLLCNWEQQEMLAHSYDSVGSMLNEA